MKFGVGLATRHDAVADLAKAADELGFESGWLPDHLIFPTQIGDLSPHPGETHAPVPVDIPTLDPLMQLMQAATVTKRIRLGTNVYNLPLRPPFVVARAIQTLDILSGGRAIFGVGAGWIPGEYAAAGVDFQTRGRRMEETMTIMRKLWTETPTSHEGEFFRFGPVVFNPKPTQGLVPLIVGGETGLALRRAARFGDGWIGMKHSPEEAAAFASRLRELLEKEGRDPATFEITVGADIERPEDVRAYEDAGVHRLVVSAGRRTSQQIPTLAAFAEQVLRPLGIR